MKRQDVVSKRWMTVLFALLALSGLVFLAACGGSSASKADVSKADIDKTITAGTWQVTLKGVPEFQKIVGASGVSSMAKNGQFVIIPVEVTNTGTDIVLFPEDLIFLKDANGEKYKLASSTPQFAYKQDHKEVDILMDSPVAPNETRKTVFMFDVPDNLSGLSLTIEGDSQGWNIGY